MIPTHVFPYRDGELRIGWASWDDGSYSARSIKYAYRDASGKISRGSPELPFDILVDMIDLATTQGELAPHLQSSRAKPANLTKASKKEVIEERKSLASRLAALQLMIADVPWADWQPVYDQLGTRYEKVKGELNKRP